MSIAEVSAWMEVPIKEVENDLEHLKKSLKHTDLKMEVMPAECKKCGFVFKENKLHKPGKCPQCKATWIEHPLIVIKEK